MIQPFSSRRAAAALLATLAITVTACGGPMNTITIDQATQQLDQHFRSATDAITAVIPGVTLQPEYDPLVGQCGPPHGTAPRGQEFVGYSNALRNLPTARNAEVYAAVEQFWAANGWTIYADRRPQLDSVYARSTDGYGMVIKTSSDETRMVFLSGNSPCVWPDGTPPG